MLDGLRARPVVRGNDKQRRVDLASADAHVANEPVVAGHVDEVELGPVSEPQVRIADVDRHPARPLFGQPIGVDARERAKQARLAVIDMARGPDHDRHPPSAARIAAVRPLSNSGSTVRRSSRTQSSSIRPITAGSPDRNRASRVAELRRGVRPSETAALGSVSPGRVPPPTVARTSTTSASPPTAAATALARKRTSGADIAIMRQTGIRSVATPAKY